MEIVENTLDRSLEEFLEQPLFCFLSTLSLDGDPRTSPLWFLWEDELIWIIGDSEKTYSKRIEHHPQTSLAIADFDVFSGRVHHVGMRGKATIVPLEKDRVYRVLRRYLDDERDDWDPRFSSLDPEQWRFIRFEPETVVARDQSFRRVS